MIYKSQHQNQQLTTGFEVFKGKKFYCGNTEKLDKGNCCFNHIVGLPINEKNGQPQPLFDYERIIISKIFEIQYLESGKENPKNRHVWVKKATGLGITEIMLRLMLWLCVRDDRYRNGQMCIITGPELQIALGLILRMKRILEQANIIIKNRETTVELNGVVIKAFPSNHLETYRGLTSPKFIFLDEGDFFRESNIRDVRDTTERYIAKSKPYIVMVSTPNKPDLLFQQIEQEDDNKCMYHRLFFNYEWGLGKMFTQDEIDLQKASPGFEREYNLKYLGKIGNVFSQLMIDKVTELGERYKGLPVNQFALHSCGVDPGFGSSRTAIVLTEHLKEEEKIRVIFSEEFDRPNPEAIANICFDIHKQYQNTWFLVDGSNAGFITTLKIKFGENPKIDYQHASPEGMRVVPVNFATEHKSMLSHLHLFVNKGYLAIPIQYDKLITSMRTAIANEYSLDKDQTSYNDSLDALRLSLRGYKMK